MGRPHPNRKFSSDIVRQVIATATTISQHAWAIKLGCTQQTIWEMRNGKTYREVYDQMERERLARYKSHAKEVSTSHADVLTTQGMSADTWKWGPPRTLTRGQLRAYLQIEEAELADRIKRGQVPGPLWGCDSALATARWDRLAVDKAVDRASGSLSHVDAATEDLDRAFRTGRQAPASRKTG